MTETHATSPVFPPGRYGRRRDPDRQRRPLWILAIVTAVVTLAVGWTYYRQYGDSSYDATVTRYTDITDTGVRIDFTVRVPEGGAAICVLRARSYDGAEVGRIEYAVPAVAGSSSLTATTVVPTTARPHIGEVVSCRAA